MKVSLEWLKEFVQIRLPVEKLSERLTMGGLEVTKTEKKEGDTILEIEITPNRPDLLSHIGIARDIAALTGMRFKLPSHHPLRAHTRNTLPLRISIQDKKGCLRYIGKLFSQIEIGETPAWMKERLERLGFRSVNNVVDITNYILLEEGQPLHAFDYDRIEGGALIIRSARRGETLLTIDGVQRVLHTEDLVIADAEKPVALAGVLGGKATELGPATKRVLLESAYFDPIRIRRTSKRLGITTESSYRFERGVSLEGVRRGADRASLLFQKWAKGEWTGPFKDLGKKSFPTKRISISLQDLDRTLGISPSVSKTRAFLEALGCRVNARGRFFRITPPSFRRDLKESVDVAEEIGRVLGYDHIPVTVPLRKRTSLGKDIQPVGVERVTTEQIKDFLVSQGLFEVVTYSLLSRALLKVFFSDDTFAIPVRNPISLEQELMRPSLILRLAEVAAHNHHRRVEKVPIFEVGPVYEKDGGLYQERKKLGILLSGEGPGNWRTKPSSYDFFDLKGRCEALVKSFDASLECVYQKKMVPFLSPQGPSMALVLGGREVGILGELAPSVTHFFDLKGKIVVAELDLSELIRAISSSKKYAPLPKYPSVRRDISLIIGKETSSEELIRAIREEGGEWVREVSLFDTYSDPRVVPAGSRGLSYRIEFLHPDRTLTDEEVNEKYQAILETLKRRGAKIRSN